MDFRFNSILVAAGCVVVLGGCVSSGTYQQKEQESQMLSKSLDESKSSYEALLQKHNKLTGEYGTLESEYTRQKGELADFVSKNGKLADANSEHAEKVKKLGTEIVDLKSENDRLGRANTELFEKVKQLAVNFLDAKGDNDKLTSANQNLTAKVQQLTADLDLLKRDHEKVVASVKPENILKTASGYLEGLQLQVNRLNDENVVLKKSLADQQAAATPSLPKMDKTPPTSVHQNNTPVPGVTEQSRPLPAPAATLSTALGSTEKASPEMDQGGAEEAPTAFSVQIEEPATSAQEAPGKDKPTLRQTE